MTSRLVRAVNHAVSVSRRESGMTTAEYAVGTMAAVAFAVALLAVVRSDAVTSALTTIITTALASGS